MRYEVRTIETGSFGPVILATNDQNEAKHTAVKYAADSYYGTAIIDTFTSTVDLGDRTVAVAEAFND